MSDRQRIGVLVGGVAGHRDLSVRAGEAVRAVLGEAGHTTELIFVDRDVDLALRQGRWDAAFLSVRGRYAADGCLQGLLELRGIPYTGSGLLASALTLDRAKTRELLRLHNLPTASAYVIDAESESSLDDLHGTFGFPVWVFPVGAERGLGSSLAHDELELEQALDEAFRFADRVMVERFVDGRRLEIGVLNGAALGAWEVGSTGDGRGGHELSGGALGDTALRGRLTPARYRSLLRLAEQAADALGIEGAATVEIALSDKMNEAIRAVDGAPWLTPNGLLARIADGAGITYPQLVRDVLSGARLRAHGHRQNRRHVQIRFEGPERRTSAPVAAH